MATTYIALLRAVNVGGTGKLAMTDLMQMCADIGFRNARTVIASGNLILESADSAAQVKAKLEQRLREYAGKQIGVVVRTAAEMAVVLKSNPFPKAPASYTVAIFLPSLISSLCCRSRLKIPAAKSGTARNMNTVGKLAAM